MIQLMKCHLEEKDQLMNLGSDKIDDFSGEGNQGLKYRDYRDAFTNTCLIDTDEVKIKGRSKNLNDIKSQRVIFNMK